MLRFIQNNDGFIGLTLSQIGLFIAVGVLLAAVFNFVFLNDWGKEEQLDSIADGLSSYIDGMDSCFFENKTKYFFKENNFDYSPHVSTEYIIVDSDSGWFDDEKLSVKKRLLTDVLPRDNRFRWKTGEELHSYLKTSFSYSGTFEDPIKCYSYSPKVDSITHAKYIMLLDEELSKRIYAKNPLKLDTEKCVYVEKVYIYFDHDNNDIWESEVDSRESILLLYQD